MAETAVMKIALPLVGVMAIWLGIMRLAERSGLVQVLARALRPLMVRLFPEVPGGPPGNGCDAHEYGRQHARPRQCRDAARPARDESARQAQTRVPAWPRTRCAHSSRSTPPRFSSSTTAIGILAINGSKNATAIVPAASSPR
jgi:hypothetical protein